MFCSCLGCAPRLRWQAWNYNTRPDTAWFSSGGMSTRNIVNKFLFRRVLVQQSQHIGYRGNMSLSNYVTELYGQSTQVTTCQLQKTDSKMARISNHLTFLTRCQKRGFTPKGLRLKPPVQSANTAKILKWAESLLIKELISDLLRQKNCLVRRKNQHIESLASTMTSRDIERILDLTTSYTAHVHEHTKTQQKLKFENHNNAV